MFKPGMKKFQCFLVVMAVSVNAFAADPSLHEVYQAAEAGHYREAQSMMDKVLRDHPNSAKAHFVEAELLAKQGRAEAAQSELTKAEHISPDLSFAKPGAVQELRAQIAALRSSAPLGSSYRAAPSPAPSIPWGMVFAAGAFLIAVMLFFRSRQNSQPIVSPGMSGYGSSTMGYPPAVGMPGYGATQPMSGGMGSGILGGLATGAAVGAGMVAGEALMHRVLDGGHSTDQYASSNGVVNDPQPRVDPNYDMGGNDFGVTDSSSWDDAGTSDSDDWN